MSRLARALAVGLLLFACSVERAPATGEPAPPFDLETVDGARRSLAGIEADFVLVDFWATWCPPCILEIPELNAFYESARDQGVDVLAISVDEDPPETLRAWVAEKGIRYPVAIGDLELARAYGANQFPYHLLLSRDGRILERLTPGFHDREELRALVARHTADAP